MFWFFASNRVNKNFKFKDTHREKLFYSIRYKNGCLAASDLFHMFTQSIKGATKLYFAHYSCAVIILFIMGLYKSAFSTDSFGNLVFAFLGFLHCVKFDVAFIHFHNICMIIVLLVGVRYSLLLFSVISKKRYRVINIWIQTRLKINK